MKKSVRILSGSGRRKQARVTKAEHLKSGSVGEEMGLASRIICIQLDSKISISFGLI